MTLCAYCQMDANDVDPEFAPEAAELPPEETCEACGLPPIAERAMVNAARSLRWKLQWENDELGDGETRAASIAERIDSMWRAA